MQNIKKYHWLMLIITIVFFIGAFYYPLKFYEQLPDLIPTHFNAKGEPDSWGDKNLGNLILGPLLTLPILLIDLPIILLLATIKDPRQLINGPPQKVQNMSLEKAEKVRSIVIFHVMFITMLTALLIMLTSIQQVIVALGQSAGLGWMPIAVLVVILADVVVLIWQIIRLIYGSERMQ